MVNLQMVTEMRRKLHQIPELGFDLYLTHELVKEYLSEFGYQFEVVAKTGLVAYKAGKQPEAIAFRADMDALAVTEQTGVPYKSLHEGKMHACGHDGHMAILLGFAKYVSTLKTLNKSILFIFQPAEEGPGGAIEIIKAGIFEKYKVEKIFGLHLFPGLDEGVIGLQEGPLLAQVGELNVEIKGQSSHGAEPHLGNDAIYALGQVINGYQSIVSRTLEPIEPAVITLGKVVGGEARNIIANQVRIEGTIRTYSEAVYEKIKTRIHEINRGLSEAYQVQIKAEIVDQYPAVINDKELHRLLLDCIKDEPHTLVKPMMISEDFSFYQRVVPGYFMLLGTRNEACGYIHPLHSCYFNFNESVLLKGIDTYIKICQALNVF